MLLVCALLSVGVVFQVSLVRVFMRACVPYLPFQPDQKKR